jgi:hypothetical protein
MFLKKKKINNFLLEEIILKREGEREREELIKF